MYIAGFEFLLMELYSWVYNPEYRPREKKVQLVIEYRLVVKGDKVVEVEADMAYLPIIWENESVSSQSQLLLTIWDLVMHKRKIK